MDRLSDGVTDGNGASVVPRRRALRLVINSTLTVGLAGCITSTRSRPGSAAKPAVSFNAEVLSSFTPDQPGRLRLQFKNESDGTLLFLTQESSGQRGLFRPVKGAHRSSRAELLLLQSGAINCQAETGTPSAIPDTPIGQSNGDGCWRPPCEDLIIYSYIPTWEELDPDTPWTGEYVLLDGFNDTCIPSGQYDFTASGRIAKGHLTDDGQFRFDTEEYLIERRLLVTIDDSQAVTATADATVLDLGSSE